MGGQKFVKKQSTQIEYMKNLIIVSGPCGVGKSTVLNILWKRYFSINTTYKNSAGANLDPTSLKSKADYTKNWFDEAIKFNTSSQSIAISDRSPFDSIAYLQESVKMFRNSVESNFRKLNKAGVMCHSILLIAEIEVLQNRIKNRYKKGGRNESIYKSEMKNLRSSFNFYQENLISFDFILDNSELSIDETVREIDNYLDRINTTANNI